MVFSSISTSGTSGTSVFFFCDSMFRFLTFALILFGALSLPVFAQTASTTDQPEQSSLELASLREQKDSSQEYIETLLAAPLFDNRWSVMYQLNSGFYSLSPHLDQQQKARLSRDCANFWNVCMRSAEFRVLDAEVDEDLAVLAVGFTNYLSNSPTEEVKLLCLLWEDGKWLVSPSLHHFGGSKLALDTATREHASRLIQSMEEKFDALYQQHAEWKEEVLSQAENEPLSADNPAELLNLAASYLRLKSRPSLMQVEQLRQLFFAENQMPRDGMFFGDLWIFLHGVEPYQDSYNMSVEHVSEPVQITEEIWGVSVLMVSDGLSEEVKIGRLYAVLDGQGEEGQETWRICFGDDPDSYLQAPNHIQIERDGEAEFTQFVESVINREERQNLSAQEDAAQALDEYLLRLREDGLKAGLEVAYLPVQTAEGEEMTDSQRYVNARRTLLILDKVQRFFADYQIELVHKEKDTCLFCVSGTHRAFPRQRITQVLGLSKRQGAWMIDMSVLEEMEEATPVLSFVVQQLSKSSDFQSNLEQILLQKPSLEVPELEEFGPISVDVDCAQAWFSFCDAWEENNLESLVDSVLFLTQEEEQVAEELAIFAECLGHPSQQVLLESAYSSGDWGALTFSYALVEGDLLLSVLCYKQQGKWKMVLPSLRVATNSPVPVVEGVSAAWDAFGAQFELWNAKIFQSLRQAGFTSVL